MSGTAGSRNTGCRRASADEEYWAQLVTPELFNVISVKPEHMAAGTLRTYIDYLNTNGLNSQRYQAGLLQPLCGCRFQDLPCCCLRSRLSFARYASGDSDSAWCWGFGIAVAFHLLSRMLGNASVVYGLPPRAGSFAPVLVVSAAAYVAYRKMAWI